MEVKVIKIAQNTTKTEQGEVFYDTWVKTKSLMFSKSGIKPNILPGMIALVDLLGEKRTILEYVWVHWKEPPRAHWQSNKAFSNDREIPAHAESTSWARRSFLKRASSVIVRKNLYASGEATYGIDSERHRQKAAQQECLVV